MGNVRVQGFADSHLSFPLELGAGGRMHDTPPTKVLLLQQCVALNFLLLTYMYNCTLYMLVIKYKYQYISINTIVSEFEG